MSSVFFFISAVLFLFGSVIGSFINVVIYRSIKGEDWVGGRSKCESCKKKIAWYDNIPLLSFLMLGGKCRHCKKPIPLIHPVVETLTGSLFVWWYWGGFLFFRLTTHPLQVLQPIFWLMVGVILLVIAVTDYLYTIIPDSFIGVLLGLTIVYRLVLIQLGEMQTKDLISTVISAAVLVAFFAFLWAVTKGRGFGLGDVKLALPLAFLMGWPRTLVGVFSAFVIGAMVASALLIIGKKKFGQVVPFGPFLVLGTGFALVWGEQVWRWYLGLL